jgi:hypothetical protein
MVSDIWQTQPSDYDSSVAFSVCPDQDNPDLARLLCRGTPPVVISDTNQKQTPVTGYPSYEPVVREKRGVIAGASAK